MSLRYIGLLLAISITFSRCAIDATKKLPPIPPECGEVSVLKNDQPWPGFVRGAGWSGNGLLWLKCMVYSEEGFLRETFGFDNIKPIIGVKQEVRGYIYGESDTLNARNGIFTADGDAHVVTYYSHETSNGFIVIDSITRDMIWGRFDSISMYPADTFNVAVEDTILFTGGWFEACVLD